MLVAAVVGPEQAGLVGSLRSPAVDNIVSKIEMSRNFNLEVLLKILKRVKLAFL